MIQPPSIFSPEYYAEIKIYQAQQLAESANKQAHDGFLTSAANWVKRNSQRRESGNPYGAAAGDPPPTPPMKTVVADDGTTTQEPFADLSTPVLPAAPPAATPTQFFGGATTGQAPVAPDRLDQVIQMLIVIKQDLDALKGAQK